MTTKFKTYPKYKPSGIKWLGDIPEGWRVKKIKFVANLYTGNSISDDRKSEFSAEIDGYPYISSKDINLNYSIINYENGMYIPIDNKDFKVAPKGSILLCIEGGSAGRKIGYTNQDVCFVNKLCCVKSKKENSRFIYYFFRSKNFQDIFELHLQGLIGGVSPSKIKDFFCPLPSMGEQKQIADFLDEKTKVVDELIVKKKKLIELLREKRAALITRAVTKGLPARRSLGEGGDPNAKLKPSGVEWLGDIPEGWKVISLKKLLSYEQPGAYIAEAIDSTDHHENMVPVLTANKGFILGYTEESSGIFDKDLPVVIFDDFTTNKQFVNFPFKVRSSALKVLKVRDKEKNDIRFIFRCMEVLDFHVLEHNRHWINIYSQENIACPPFEEQKQIADFLDAETAKIDKAVSLIESQIKKLKEYRSSLIYHAVTGKMKI